MFADKLVASQNIYKTQEEIALLSKKFYSKVEKIFIAKINLLLTFFKGGAKLFYECVFMYFRTKKKDLFFDD